MNIAIQLPLSCYYILANCLQPRFFLRLFSYMTNHLDICLKSSDVRQVGEYTIFHTLSYYSQQSSHLKAKVASFHYGFLPGPHDQFVSVTNAKANGFITRMRGSSDTNELTSKNRERLRTRQVAKRGSTLLSRCLKLNENIWLRRRLKTFSKHLQVFITCIHKEL